jgi:protein gp37
MDSRSVGPFYRSNVWLGTSIACQEDADRNIPELLKCRDLCAKLFLSIEPLVGPVDLLIDGECSGWACHECGSRNVDTEVRVADDDVSTYACGDCGYVGGGEDANWKSLIDWVIVGGESGPNARPCDIAWIRSIVRQCREAGVPVFVKQLGAAAFEWAEIDDRPRPEARDKNFLGLRDPKGGDPAEWPEDVRVREVP